MRLWHRPFVHQPCHLCLPWGGPDTCRANAGATSSEAASTDSAPYAEPQPASSLGDPIISWGRHAAPQALATSADPLAPSQRLAEPASEASWASGGDAPPAVSLQGPPASGTQSLPAAAGHLLPSNAPAPGEPHARHPSAPRLTRLKPEELFQLHAAALGQAQLSGGMKGAVPTTPQLQALQALPSSQYSPLVGALPVIISQVRDQLLVARSGGGPACQWLQKLGMVKTNLWICWS